MAVAGSLDSNGMAPPTEIQEEICIRQLKQTPELESNFKFKTGIHILKLCCVAIKNIYRQSCIIEQCYF